MRLSASIALAITVLLAASIARSAEPTREDLIRQIDELRQRVSQLEAQQQQAVRSADVDAIVEAVLKDADRRSQLLQSSGAITAGFDQGKFFLRSEDGNFLLQPGFVFQVRYATNWNSADDDDTESGFEIRRMKLVFEGNAFTPDLQYKFQFDTRTNDGDVFLQDAWVRYRFAPEWQVQAGQFKDIIYHEETMLDQLVLVTERSLANALIGGGQTERIQGAMLMYDSGQAIRANALFHDGFNSDNTDYTDSAGGTGFIGVAPTNFGVSARADWFVMGTRKAYDDFTALGTNQDLLVVGGGADWSQGGDSDVIFHTVDAQYEDPSGLGLYGALLGLWRDIGADSPVPEGNYYDWGGLVQASYLVNPRCEVFARYDYTSLDDDALPAGTEDQIHEVTVGSNYYWRNHNVKLTIDLNWLPNGSPTNVPGLDVAAGDDDELILRGQVQFYL